MPAICGIQARKKNPAVVYGAHLFPWALKLFNCSHIFLMHWIRIFAQLLIYNKCLCITLNTEGNTLLFACPLWEEYTFNGSCHISTRGVLTLFHLPLCLFSVRLVERKKAAVKRCEEQLLKMEVQATDREENKQIALGTSKLNYLDPRISVAWWVNTDTFDAVVKRLVPWQADAWIKADTKCEHTDKVGFQIELLGASPPGACITKIIESAY